MKTSLLLFLCRCLCAAVVALRVYDLTSYPRLQVDEGLFAIQAKDAVLFGDSHLNRLNPDTVVVTPGHFAMAWTLFHIAPGTIFSIRQFNAFLGCLTLVVAWKLCQEQLGTTAALWSLAVLGLSFTLITTNRRAFLETGVTLLSLLAVWLSTKSSRVHLVGLAVAVGALLLYKMNAVYLMPSLLVPAATEGLVSGIVRRSAAVLGGALIAALTFYALYTANPQVFIDTYSNQLNMIGPEQPLVHVGRFGLFPHNFSVVSGMVARLATDLLAMTALAIGGAVLTLNWRDRFTAKLWLWLIGGYVLCAIQFSHMQYYLPLIAPAALLTVVALDRLPRSSAAFQTYRVLVIFVIVFSLVRLGASWYSTRMHNPPLDALHWLESQGPDAVPFAASPEITAATEKKGYILYFVTHPSLAQHSSVELASALQSRHIKSIVYDDWESAPYFADDRPFLDSLNAYTTVVEQPEWKGIRVP